MANILNDSLTQQLIAVGFPEPQSVLSAKMDHRSILSVEIGYSLEELWEWLPIAIKDSRTELRYRISIESSVLLGWHVMYSWEPDIFDTAGEGAQYGEYQVLTSAFSSNILNAVASILLECARLQGCKAIYDYARGCRPFNTFLNG